MYGQQCLIFDEENWWEVLDDLPVLHEESYGYVTGYASGTVVMSREQQNS